jgi:anaerobic selenocysteine-containing dehydrogenase
MAESKVTTNHDEIRKWVDARGGHPARVKGTDLLRIDYPAYSGEDTLEPISWEEFFETFDGNKLAFLYQEKLESGETSRFSKLIERNSAEAKAA